MSDWSLRLARPGDAELMPAIEAAAAARFAELPELAALDFSQTRDAPAYQRLIRKGHCLVTHVGDEMVGFLACEPFGRELHIWEIDVLPNYQGRGIGSGLLRACMVDARNSGFSALTLTTFREVPWNAPFYARLGFEEVTALDAHPRLAGELAVEADNGFPAQLRAAMIHFVA